MVTKLPNASQLTLTFEPGLAARHRSLRACMAAGVYAVGLDRVAVKCDEAPSKLCEKLGGGNGDRTRDVGLDLFERYIEKTGDVQPIYYLIDKYLRDGNATRDAALVKLAQLADELPSLLAAAGVRK